MINNLGIGESFKDGHIKGQVDLVQYIDIAWTTSRTTCEWYLAEGGNPILLPEGCNPNVYYPIKNLPQIEVSFVGEKYGFRNNIIKHLKSNGINVSTFGKGWSNNYISFDEVNKVYSRSKIKLGFGGIRYSECLTNVKGRDFDIPCSGGGLYITSYNPELTYYYDIGKEIVCYRNRDEIIELIKYYLNNQEEATKISIAGRERCLTEHRWIHRYTKICNLLGILEN